MLGDWDMGTQIAIWVPSRPMMFGLRYSELIVYAWSRHTHSVRFNTCTPAHELCHRHAVASLPKAPEQFLMRPKHKSLGIIWALMNEPHRPISIFAHSANTYGPTPPPRPIVTLLTWILKRTCIYKLFRETDYRKRPRARETRKIHYYVSTASPDAIVSIEHWSAQFFHYSSRIASGIMLSKYAIDFDDDVI